ncbi:MAG: helix-hairpin-helix domain-containing protein [Deltaproteobacteria bacterium]|nr:helix-hairpin-helix domain-containing protein [Deltaproteobacteria bacterium]
MGGRRLLFHKLFHKEMQRQRSETAVGPQGARASAALLLGALVLAAAWPPGPAPDASCPHPREVEAEQGWTSEVDCSSGDAGEAGTGAAALRGPVRLLFGEPLDLNRADLGSLEALPGIGPKRAEAIVRTRAERPFASVPDLERVPGIGPKTRAGLAPWVAVEGP